MPRIGTALDAAATLSILFALGVVAPAADIDLRPVIIELRPGLTKIVKPGRPVQAVVVGNPNIVDASVINLSSIAITGKGIGATNLVLFDEEGEEISSSRIQVVRGDAFRYGNRMERYEVSVMSLGKPTRRYLCRFNCSEMNDAPALSSNPPTAGAPATSTTATTTVINLPGLAAPVAPGTAVPAPPGTAAPAQ